MFAEWDLPGDDVPDAELEAREHEEEPRHDAGADAEDDVALVAELIRVLLELLVPGVRSPATKSREVLEIPN